MNEDIFTFENDEALEGWKKAAEQLGINPNALGVDDGDPRKFAPKRNCKRCRGRGTLKIILSPSKEKVHMVNRGELNYRARSKQTPQQAKIVAGFYPGNDIPWDTRHPEPPGYKQQNAANVYCRCLRPA